MPITCTIPFWALGWAGPNQAGQSQRQRQLPIIASPRFVALFLDSWSRCSTTHQPHRPLLTFSPRLPSDLNSSHSLPQPQLQLPLILSQLSATCRRLLRPRRPRGCETAPFARSRSPSDFPQAGARSAVEVPSRRPRTPRPPPQRLATVTMVVGPTVDQPPDYSGPAPDLSLVFQHPQGLLAARSITKTLIRQAKAAALPASTDPQSSSSPPQSRPGMDSNHAGMLNSLFAFSDSPGQSSSARQGGPRPIAPAPSAPSCETADKCMFSLDLYSEPYLVGRSVSNNIASSRRPKRIHSLPSY